MAKSDRSASASLGDGSTGGEELQLKECAAGCERPVRRPGQRDSQSAAQSWPEVRPTAPAPLGDGSTGNEKLHLKKLERFWKNCKEDSETLHKRSATGNYVIFLICTF
nr:hypothetical protein [Bacillus amyloliquefaciens]